MNKLCALLRLIVVGH